MVANLRCNELRDEAQEQVKLQVQALIDQASHSKIDDFQGKCKLILKTAVAHYEEYAHQYDKSVYEKVKKELIALLLNQLFLCFD